MQGLPQPFTVTIGTVMERSKVPLCKWVLAAQLMASSKKGMSALQLQRMIGTNYETAWFLFHRLRECATDPEPGPIGGKNKVVEADETYVGGKARNKAFGPPPKKQAVFSLVERGGEVRSFHVADVSAKTLRRILFTTASRKSYLMTDEATTYTSTGRGFAGHGTVVHSAKEYVRGGFWSTNTVESYFALLNRHDGAAPVASGLPNRTGVCGARRGTPSQREMDTGRAFDRQIGSTKRGDGYADCRIRVMSRVLCQREGGADSL